MQDCDWLIQMNQSDEIAQNLWMGSAPIRIVPPMFSFVVNVNDYLDYSFAKTQMILHIKLDDCQLIPSESVLHLLADFVNSARKVGPTLVHCQAGLNRSGIVTALALIKNGMTANDAIAQMRKARGPDVLCNPWFVTWLQALGKDVTTTCPTNNQST